LAIPNYYLEDYISFRLNIKKELKKDIFIFLPQNNVAPKAKSQVTFKLPAKKIYGEPQRYDLEKYYLIRLIIKTLSLMILTPSLLPSLTLITVMMNLKIPRAYQAARLKLYGASHNLLVKIMMLQYIK